MKRKVIYACFALMLLGISLSSCRSQELCPAYTEDTTETQNISEGSV